MRFERWPGYSPLRCMADTIRPVKVVDTKRRGVCHYGGINRGCGMFSSTVFRRPRQSDVYPAITLYGGIHDEYECCVSYARGRTNLRDLQSGGGEQPRFQDFNQQTDHGLDD